MGEAQNKRWLFERGGPIIRWRTATELGEDLWCGVPTSPLLFERRNPHDRAT